MEELAGQNDSRHFNRHGQLIGRKLREQQMHKRRRKESADKDCREQQQSHRRCDERKQAFSLFGVVLEQICRKQRDKRDRKRATCQKVVHDIGQKKGRIISIRLYSGTCLICDNCIAYKPEQTRTENTRRQNQSSKTNAFDFCLDFRIARFIIRFGCFFVRIFRDWSRNGLDIRLSISRILNRIAGFNDLSRLVGHLRFDP